MAGVRKGRRRELGRETSRAQIPPSPSPFNACTTGYVRSSNRNNLTVEPLLWYSSIQGTPPLRNNLTVEPLLWYSSIQGTPPLRDNLTVEPLLWYSSIQGTPPLREHRIWSQKNVQIIFVFVTSIEETHTSIERTQDLLPQKCSHNLCFVSSIEGTPLLRGQKIWFHKKIC